MTLGEVVGHLFVGSHHVFVGLTRFGHDVEVGPEFDGTGGDIGVEAPTLEGGEHGLEDHPAQGSPVGLFLRFAETAVAPVHGVRLGQTPFQRSVLVVDLLHDGGHQLELVDHDRHPVAVGRGVGLEQGRVVGPAARDDVFDLPGPPGFVGHVGVIEICAHLVLVDPTQLAVHQRLVRVVAHALVAQ